MFCTCSCKHVKNSYCFRYGPASFLLNLHDSHFGRTVLKRFFNSKSTDASESPQCHYCNKGIPLDPLVYSISGIEAVSSKSCSLESLVLLQYSLVQSGFFALNTTGQQYRLLHPRIIMLSVHSNFCCFICCTIVDVRSPSLGCHLSRHGFTSRVLNSGTVILIRIIALAVLI